MRPKTITGHRAKALAVAGIVAVLATLVVPAASAVGVLTISGTVTNAWGTPVANATLTDGVGHFAYTDASGNYSFQETNTGSYTITVQAAGMANQSAAATLSLTQPSATQNFTLLYLSGFSVNQRYFSTASAAATLTITMQTYTPNPGTPGGAAGTSCAYVYDSRIGHDAAMSYVSTSGALATWTLSEPLAVGTPEGTYQLWTGITGCAGGTASTPGSPVLDTEPGPSPYVVQNQAPSVGGLIPADNGDTLSVTPVISAFATDSLAGINPASAAMTLDGAAVVPSANAVGSTGALIAYTPGAALAPGTHTVAVTVADNAGNATSVSWSFAVVSLSATVTALGKDISGTATVPTVPSTNETVTVSGIALDLGPTTVTMPDSAHAGFGELCGAADLSGLRAVFQTPAGPEEQAPQANPGTQSACTPMSDLAPGTGLSFTEGLAGWAAPMGNLSFAVPTTALPGSQVSLAWASGPPSLAWATSAPGACYGVNATPGAPGPVTESVCDPWPDYLSGTQAQSAWADVHSRQQSLIASGYTFEGAVVEPSVWAAVPTAGSSQYNLTEAYQLAGPGAALAPGGFAATPIYAAGLGPASPYQQMTPPAASVLYEEADRYAKADPAGGADSTTEAYFRWDPSYPGEPAQASYVGLSWTGGPETATADSLFDVNGTNVAGKADDTGHAIAWNAYQATSASGTNGRVLGFEQRFTLAGNDDRVVSGWLDESTSANPACAYCAIATLWAQDPSKSEAFSNAPLAPEIQADSTGIPAVDNLVSTAECALFGGEQCAASSNPPPPSGSGGSGSSNPYNEPTCIDTSNPASYYGHCYSELEGSFPYWGLYGEWHANNMYPFYTEKETTDYSIASEMWLVGSGCGTTSSQAAWVEEGIIDHGDPNLPDSNGYPSQVYQNFYAYQTTSGVYHQVNLDRTTTSKSPTYSPNGQTMEFAIQQNQSTNQWDIYLLFGSGSPLNYITTTPNVGFWYGSCAFVGAEVASVPTYHGDTFNMYTQVEGGGTAGTYDSKGSYVGWPNQYGLVGYASDKGTFQDGPPYCCNGSSIGNGAWSWNAPYSG